MQKTIAKKYNSITYLRVFAMLLIAYVHLGPARNGAWVVNKGLDYLFFTPLRMINYGSAFGVCLFFLITGFLIYPMRQNILAKLKGVLLRILLPLVGAMACFYLFAKADELLVGANYWSQYSLSDWLETTFLVNYFRGEGSYINGVLWYLIPNLFFTLTFTILSPIAKQPKGVFTAIVIYDIALFAICTAVPNLFAVLPFAFMPVFGMIIREVVEHDEKMNWYCLIAEAVLTYLLMVMAFQRDIPHYYRDGYIVSLLYAILLFALLMFNDSKIKAPGRGVALLSNISYEFYLLHSMVGGLVMSGIGNTIESFTVCFIIGIAVSLAFSWMVWYIFERKIIGFIKNR